MDSGTQDALGRLKIALGTASLLFVAYLILALHTDVPGSETLRTAYDWRFSRRLGPPLVTLPLIGGLILVWWGLRDLGIATYGPFEDKD